MRKPSATQKEAVIRFFTAPFYWLFCIVYFIVSLPKRFRRRRHFRVAPKKIILRRLANTRVKALDAMSLILQLRETEQSEEFLMKRSPTIFELLEMLWEEELSACFRIPMVSELHIIRTELTEDVHIISSGTPPAEVAVWALDDQRHVFVGYCPFTGHTTDALPQFFDAVSLHKRPPDSQVHHFAYAVSIMLRHDDQ